MFTSDNYTNEQLLAEIEQNFVILQEIYHLICELRFNSFFLITATQEWHIICSKTNL